ncbi:FAD-dependent oxidoreductase [Limibacillus sp. MBR-115]|uniref:oxidoreductase n=1 Tax=Limibacillus sp. MBR-115 TaxID=3156465 RepID=UPI0033957E50
MTRDPRYDVLFEPVRIGPLTARNRFYQVPHCSGMGRAWPQALAAIRAMKAAGGWAVVNTEYCSIHPSSDDTPYPYASLWDAGDVRANARMTEAVHDQGALAGVELWHGGNYVANLASREPPIDIMSLPSRTDPVQSRVLYKEDIRALRRWHSDAAKRAVEAGFDLVYVYATHAYLLDHFLSPVSNQRTDEYGGSLENRVRILRELLIETREAIGPDRALAVRFTAANLGGKGAPTEELREMLSILGPLADIWDLVVDDYTLEMGSSRFVEEGAQESYLAGLRQLLGKPVVGVGRFTSPDTMVGMVKRGVLDFIGAARPSIADPFLPRKIEEGRSEEIRECIGCNICYASNSRGNPIRCTQNPTMGEEWRSGWHPEQIEPAGSKDSVLVVGAGPAGLEAAVALARRGYEVTLAEASDTLGGRVTRESRLPGLAAWGRVRDHRLELMKGLPNLQVYPASRMSAADVLGFGAPVVALATGAAWRRDGIGRLHRAPQPGFDSAAVLTPDDLMSPEVPDLPPGPVVIYDDDRYYMAAVLAEKLALGGRAVTLVTTGGTAAAWAYFTEELDRTNARLLSLGVTLRTSSAVVSFDGAGAEVSCLFSDRREVLAAVGLVTVTARSPEDSLYRQLIQNPAALRDSGIRLLQRVGDCLAPALIAHAVHAGHRFARELDASKPRDAARRELAAP